MRDDAVLPYNVLPRDGQALYDWVMRSQPSDQIAYYRGHLGRDRQVFPPGRSRVLEFAADVMMAAAEAGFVSALQMRLGELDYLYISKRTKKKFEPIIMQKTLESVFSRRFLNVKGAEAKVKKEQARMEHLQMQKTISGGLL